VLLAHLSRRVLPGAGVPRRGRNVADPPHPGRGPDGLARGAVAGRAPAAPTVVVRLAVVGEVARLPVVVRLAAGAPLPLAAAGRRPRAAALAGTARGVD